MCTILIAPEMRTTKRFTDAYCCQDFKVKRAERTENHQRQLNMKWGVVTDEQGNRRLEMRWTVARSSIPSTRCKPAPRSVQPARGGIVIELPARRHE